MKNPLSVAVKHIEGASQCLGRIGINLNDTKTSSITANMLEELKTVDANAATVLGRVLDANDSFATEVHRHSGMVSITNNQKVIADQFDDILSDAKALYSQEVKGGPNILERLQNSWMNISRGSIPKRFNQVEKAFTNQIKETQKALFVENIILTAYMNFRGSLQASQVHIHRLYAKQQQAVEAMREEYVKLSDSCIEEGISPDEKMSRLFARDALQKEFKDQQRKCDILKRFHETLSITNHTTDAVIASLDQTHEVKQQLMDQSVIFYSANRNLFASTEVTIQAQAGTQQNAMALQAMLDGTDRCLKNIAEYGTVVNEDALRLAHGTTIKSETVKELMDSITTFVSTSRDIINKAKAEATIEHKKIEEIVIEGKHKMAQAIDGHIRSESVLEESDVFDISAA